MVVDLPPRYRSGWKEPLRELIAARLRPGVRILDVGGGREPFVPPDARSAGSHYAGLDLSLDELERAPSGSYDDLWQADVTEFMPELEGRFDLVISFQVLEHVRPLENAIENMHRYLRSGGVLGVQMSSTFSVFGLINQVIPQRLTVWLLRRLLDRDPQSIFPAYYHHCWYARLEEAFEQWSSVRIIPRYVGASYFRFSSLLQRLYLLYENWAYSGGHYNLATHYIVIAAK